VTIIELIIESKIIKISKILSYILRHNPHRFKTVLDEEGWADMNNVLNSLHNFKDLTDLKKEDLLYLISNQDKIRFVIKENKIKATHGHSIEVKKNTPIIPPDILYHGTSHKYIKSIYLHGLLKMQRQFLHLSIDTFTAMKIGNRKDNNPAIIMVDSKKACKGGVLFYKGSDKVGLSENTLPKYLKEIK
jgi:putative RNA 2'-phosphotransferase